MRDQTGRLYRAEIWGEAGDDGRWSGWLEFTASHGRRLKTPPETVQPNRTDLLYWASGLGAIYLEGAFQRAQMATP